MIVRKRALPALAVLLAAAAGSTGIALAQGRGAPPPTPVVTGDLARRDINVPADVPNFSGTGDHSMVVALAPTGKVDTGTTISVLVSRTGADTSADHPAPAHHDLKPQPKAKPPVKHGPDGHVPPGKAKEHGGPGPH